MKTHYLVTASILTGLASVAAASAHVSERSTIGGSSMVHQAPTAIYRHWLGSLPVAGVAPNTSVGRSTNLKAWMDEADPREPPDLNTRAGSHASGGPLTTVNSRAWADEYVPTTPAGSSIKLKTWMDEADPREPPDLNTRVGSHASDGPLTTTNSRAWADEYVPATPAGRSTNTKAWADEYVPTTPTSRSTNLKTWLDEYDPIEPADLNARTGSHLSNAPLTTTKPEG